MTGRFKAYVPQGEEAIRQRVPQVWTMFWAFFSVLFVTWLISIPFGISQNEENIPFGIFLNEALLLLVTGIYAFRYRRILKSKFNLSGLANRWFWLCLVLLVPTLLFNYFWHLMIMQFTWGESGLGLSGLKDRLGDPVMILVFCVLPGVLEEVAFRGLLQSWLMVALKPVSALLLASALFAGIHCSILSMPPLFVAGLLLGLVYYKTRCLWPCIIIHFLHNLIAVYCFSF
ncbi:MAG: CPBP family intramembrane metalloprotease [bacterium]|nr:CPBP family intramembrane metalloprotease [bacterium]